MQSLSERSAPASTFLQSERWRRYARTRDRQARDELVLAYAPLVKYVAGGMASRMPPHVELAELVSYGLGGLIKAVEGFDPARGASFESYAHLRIRGAIVDELRSQDWVPRAVREEARVIEQAREALTTRLRRVPTTTELAAELGLDSAELDAALQRIAATQTVALDHPVSGPEGSRQTLMESLADTEAAELGARLDADELRDSIAAVLEELPHQEQIVLGLRYQQDLLFAEIAEILSLTESRISQIHSAALRRLRAILPDDVAPQRTAATAAQDQAQHGGQPAKVDAPRPRSRSTLTGCRRTRRGDGEHARQVRV